MQLMQLTLQVTSCTSGVRLALLHPSLSTEHSCPLPLQLRKLDLSDNLLSGLLPDKDWNSAGAWPMLQMLDLGGNAFFGAWNWPLLVLDLLRWGNALSLCFYRCPPVVGAKAEAAGCSCRCSACPPARLTACSAPPACLPGLQAAYPRACWAATRSGPAPAARAVTAT